jgi:ABC-2 type transport system permease protein
MFRLELYKLIRSKSFPIGFGALTLFLSLVLWGFWTYAGKQAADTTFRFSQQRSGYFNGTVFALLAVHLAFYLLMPVFVALIAGQQIAGEARAGTLRQMLSRPVARWRIIAAKFGVTVFYALLLQAFFIALTLFVGYTILGGGKLILMPGILNLVDEPTALPQDVALRRFIYAVFTGAWSLLTLASLAFLLSVILDNPVNAVICAVSLYLVLHIVGSVDFFVALKPYFFTVDMECWKDVFKPDIPRRAYLFYASKCGIYTIGLLLAATALFERKDVTD